MMMAVAVGASKSVRRLLSEQIHEMRDDDSQGP